MTSVEEAVLLRTQFFTANRQVVTTVPLSTPVFDFANNISVPNNTFTPVAGGVYLIEINLTTWPTIVTSSGAAIFCQIYKDGTTPPNLDTSYGSSHYYPQHNASVITVSLSWTSVLEANVAYKFGLWQTPTASITFYSGTSTLDCTLRVSKKMTSVEEAVLLRTQFFSTPNQAVTTIPLSPPVFDFANNISVPNNTFTPVEDGIFYIDINLTTWPKAVPYDGAAIFCQIYKDGTTPPSVDTSYGSSHYYPEHAASVITVSLSWTSALEANVAYKFGVRQTPLPLLTFYSGTTTLDCTLRVYKL